jgi:hypothetical protein
MKQRGKHGYRLHDNCVDLVDGRDIVLMSGDYWDLFSTRYGADVTIQLRKYDNVQQMVPRQTKRGRAFSTFPVLTPIETTWYDVNSEAKEWTL